MTRPEDCPDCGPLDFVTFGSKPVALSYKVCDKHSPFRGHGTGWIPIGMTVGHDEGCTNQRNQDSCECVPMSIEFGDRDES